VSEQHGAAARHSGRHEFPDHLVGVAVTPAAVAEAAAGVLVGPARALHDAVERDVLDRADPAHSVLLVYSDGPS
jgi:hypothetical protein